MNTLTPWGWTIMLLSVGSVTLLFVWCVYRVLFHKPRTPTEHMHGMEDIDTRDKDEC
jgi:hypothetical protein